MTLYISDLDGTLMNSQKEISENTRTIINGLISEGMQFSVATARGLKTTSEILKGIHFKVPIILMNGTAVYDLSQKKYIKIFGVEKETARAVIDLFQGGGHQTFVYAKRGERIIPYYSLTLTPMHKALMCENNEALINDHEQVSRFDEIIDECDIATIESVGDGKSMDDLYQKTIQVKGIHGVMYRDVYGSDNYHVELFSSGASKATAIRYLAKMIRSDKLVTFGDHVNDLSMFEISDECFATANAVDSLKEKATAVIGLNDHDSVAHQIRDHFKK